MFYLIHKRLDSKLFAKLDRLLFLMDKYMDLTLSLIEQASHFLKGKIRQTPTEYSSVLSDLLQVPVYLKLENLQITGSFKIRGALFYLSQLQEKERQKGIGCCSAGNHGLGVAYAAKELGVSCTVFVPKNVDEAKYKKILKLGAKVIKSEFIGYDETLEWATQEATKSGLHLISAFDDEIIMAGNGGSLAVEVLEEIPDAQNFILPVGGGGLSGGFSYYVKKKKPEAKVIGCQHVGSPGLQLSLEQGNAVTELPPLDTVAGGLEGGVGKKCFSILKDRINEVALSTEEEIIQGFRWILENHQYLIEPTAAIVIACCLYQKIKTLKGTTVLILSGRNVSYGTVKKLIG